MKTKNYTSISFTLLSLVLVLVGTSCKKEKIQGCDDPLALNYDIGAEKNDGTCKYNADMLTGYWNAHEMYQGDTSHYLVNISKSDIDNISISSNRTNPPLYYFNNLIAGVNWTERKIEKPESTVTGKILNDHDFQLQYPYGTPTVDTVRIHYTR
jgi:hypothetical protein